VAALAPLVEKEIGGPYAIFGHSMGALLGYELTRELERRGRPPVWLGVSAMTAPNLVSSIYPDRRDLWTHARLVEFIRKMGGTPEELLLDASVAEYLVRLLRLDLRLVDTYEYLTGPALATPLSVFYGADDPLTRPDNVDAWRSYCTGQVTVHRLAGGHFSFFEQARTVAPRMIADIDAALARR
jgi:surfactin synthase thioesterase subunit